MTFAYYGLATVVALALSLLKGRRHSSVRMALMMLAFWAIANVTPAWVDPWIDASGFYLSAAVWFGRPQCRWCMVLTAVFTSQMLVHVAFIGDHTSYWRIFTLNVLYAIGLVAIAAPGGMLGLRNIRDRCSGRAWSGHLDPVSRISREG